MGSNEKMYCVAHPGKTIKKWMDAREMSEGALSRLSKVTQPTIHRIITGESRDPRRSNLEKLARVFGRTVDDLYDPDSEPGQLTLDDQATQFAVMASSLTDDQIDIILRTIAEFQKNA